MHKDLVLRVCYSVVRVGSCLVVVGGSGDPRVLDFTGEADDGVRSVEVFDTKRNTVWSLPEFRESQSEFSAAVVVSNEIVVLGGDMPSGQTSKSERLPLVDKNSAVYKLLLDGPSLQEFDWVLRCKNLIEC